MKATHTPGPWSVAKPNAQSSPNAAAGLIIDNNRRLIGQAFTSRGVTEDGHTHSTLCDLPRETVEANARLIAEAPAMREELQETEYGLTQMLVVLGAKQLPDSARKMIVAIRDRNRAILARINGKETV